MSRIHSLNEHPTRPPLSVRKLQNNTVVVEISVPSSELVRTVQDLTKPGGTPNIEQCRYDGLLKGDIVWRVPLLNGEEHRFSVEGVRIGQDETVFTLVIYNASAGFNGTGPKELARALAHLRIGTESFLRQLLTKPYPTRRRADIPDDKRDAWMETLSATDFGPQYG